MNNVLLMSHSSGITHVMMIKDYIIFILHLFLVFFFVQSFFNIVTIEIVAVSLFFSAILWMTLSSMCESVGAVMWACLCAFLHALSK